MRTPKILKAALLILAVSFMTSSLEAREYSARYRGQWNSQSTGHSGPMRVRLQPNRNGGYQAVFVGRFAGVIPFMYRATLNPTGYGTYSSNKQLGPLLGEYRMNATINGGYFSASFQAAGDSGTFTMRRTH
jgi:hypothetical protein